MKFKEHLSESLNSPVEFTITDDTDIPNQFYAVTQVNGTDYGFALYRTKYDKVYTIEMYRVVTKKKRFWSFKSAADVRIVMSTLMKFIESVYPFVKSKMDGAILEIPSGTSSESYMKFLTLIVNKFYIKTFAATPVTKTTDKASNYLFVTKKVVKPETIFKTASFHKHFTFGEIPKSEHFDEIKEPLKVQPITLSYTPEPKFALGEFEVTSLADLSVLPIDAVTRDNSKVTSGEYDGKTKDPNKIIPEPTKGTAEPVIEVKPDIKYGFAYSGEADTKKYGPDKIPFFHFVSYLATTHKIGNARNLIKSLKAYIKNRGSISYSNKYKADNAFRESYYYAHKLLNDIANKDPSLIAGMDSTFLYIHDSASLSYYNFKDSKNHVDKTTEMIAVYEKTAPTPYVLKKNMEMFGGFRNKLGISSYNSYKPQEEVSYANNKKYTHSKIEIPIVLKSGIKAFRFADEGVSVNPKSNLFIMEPGDTNKTASKQLAISKMPQVVKFINELDFNAPIKKSIKDYTGSNSGMLNNNLREYIKGGGNIYQGFDALDPNFYDNIKKQDPYEYDHKRTSLLLIENMLRAFEMAPVAEEAFWVYRNADFDGHNSKEVSDELIDAGALSTSLNPEFKLGYGGNTRLKIFVPKGARFIPVYSFSTVKGESEIILPPMSVLKITEKYTTKMEYSSSNKLGFVCVWTGSAFKSTIEKMRDGKPFTLKEELEQQDEVNLKKESKWKDKILDNETQEKVLQAIEDGEIELDD